MKILFVDTETTGLSAKPGANELVQIGCHLTTGRGIIESISIKSQPTNWHRVDQKALEVTHLTKDILRSYPTPKESFDKFYAFITPHFDGKNKIHIGGQNVKFDIRFTELWWNTWKNPDQLAFTDIFNVVDCYELQDLTKELKKLGILVVDNVKLGTVANALMISPEGELHNAMTDIDLTHKVMFGIIDRLKLLNNDQLNFMFIKYMALT